MKFKTTIQITTEAEDKNEAVEIVDEYLSGYLSSGVDMRCTTRHVRDYRPAAAILTCSVIILISLFASPDSKSKANFILSNPAISAIQVPLNTISAPGRDNFKKEWDIAQIKEGLNRIKK